MIIFLLFYTAFRKRRARAKSRPSKTFKISQTSFEKRTSRNKKTNIIYFTRGMAGVIHRAGYAQSIRFRKKESNLTTHHLISAETRILPIRISFHRGRGAVVAKISQPYKTSTGELKAGVHMKIM